MKRRSTLIHDKSVNVPQHFLQLTLAWLKIQGLNAVREERLTFGLDELPKEVRRVLKQSNELHIRWASEAPYSVASPLNSRTSPGLHVHFTPLGEHKPDLLCPLLHKFFSEELKCSSPDTTFTTPSLISSRFASTSSLYYHSLLPSLRNLINYIQTEICPNGDQNCLQSASLLSVADSFDVDYDSISHALTVTATWFKPPPVFFDPVATLTFYNSWSVTYLRPDRRSKIEVGVLSADASPSDPSEVQLSGFLAVIGEDTVPTSTLFSYPSRHHSLPASQPFPQNYTTSFDRPTGLHPTFRITFPSSSSLTRPLTAPADSTCALHAYLTLPSTLFADTHQLSTTDPLFLFTHNLRALRSISGETDLEAPNYVVQKWGSTVLLELATPSPETANTANTTTTSSPSSPYSVTIPLHLRYLSPSSSGHTGLRVPWPIVFWACTSDAGTKFPVNPFDRTNLGYDGLFGPRTMFFHLDPVPPAAAAPAAATAPHSAGSRSGILVEEIQVPVLDLNAPGAAWVGSGTVFVVLLGFAWVAWKVWLVWKRGMPERKQGPVETDKKTK